MKRIIKTGGLLALALCLTAVLCLPALADVIMEPQDDFYSAHADEMEYVNREYYTNGEIGYTPISGEPGGRVLGYARNGQVFLVSFVYTDAAGARWGLVEYAKDGDLFTSAPYTGKAGYIALDDATGVYDSQAFYEEHEAEFKSYSGDGSELSGGAVLWTFPRSGTFYDFEEDLEPESVVIDLIYTYDDGQEWGHMGYYYGLRNVWVCLSDPINRNIPSEIPDLPDFIEPTGDVPSVGMNPVTLAALLVAAVAVISIILILVLRKKKGGVSQ